MICKLIIDEKLKAHPVRRVGFIFLSNINIKEDQTLSDSGKIYVEIVGGPHCGRKVYLGEIKFEETIFLLHMGKEHMYKLRKNKEISTETFYDYVGKK